LKSVRLLLSQPLRPASELSRRLKLLLPPHLLRPLHLRRLRLNPRSLELTPIKLSLMNTAAKV
jgi:hypothetical protein